MKSKTNINDDPILEKEADVMGAKAEKVGNEKNDSISQLQSNIDNSDQVSQLVTLNNSINNQEISSNDNQFNSVDNSETLENNQAVTI